MSGVLRLSVIVDGQTREATAKVNEVTAALNRLEGQAKTTGPAAATALRQTGQAAGQAAQLSTQQLTNMQFQLQDMVIGLTSGQSPFTVMMQQGSQVAQAFNAGTGPRAAIAAFGQGILQFVSNPLNLVVGVSALAATAVTSFFSAISSGTAQTDALLENHARLIESIGKAYDDAKGKAEGYARALTPAMLLEAQIRGPNLAEGLDMARGGIAGTLRNTVQSRTAAGDQMMLQAEGGLESFNRIARLIADASPGLESGTASAADLVKEIQKIATEAPPTAQGLRLFINELIGGTDGFGTKIEGVLTPLAQLQKAFDENEAIIAVIKGTATGAQKAMVGLDESTKAATGKVNGLARALGNIPETIGGYGPRERFAGAPNDVAGKSFLDLLGAAEGTDRGRGYNETLGYGKFTGGPVDLVTMTLKQVIELQGRMLADPSNAFNSSAVGRYQITRETLSDFMPRLGLTADTVFTPDVQDKIALAIANAAGRSVERLQGRWEGLNRIGSGTILQAFDGAGDKRSGVAEGIEGNRLAEEKIALRERELEVTSRIAESVKQQNADERAYQKTAAEMLREQIAFTDQFRGITDGMVSRIAMARAEGESWTDSLAAGLDMVEQKAMSFLDKLIDGLADAALFGAKGTSGGGLLGGFLGLLGGLANPMQNALGNVFENGSVMKFAKGDVFNIPMMFPMRGGAGVFAEAGPEAIMPLTRAPSGHLGVRALGGGGGGSVVNLNVVNNAGADVQTQQRQNADGSIDIDLMLERKMESYLGREDTTRRLQDRLGIKAPAQAWG